MSSILDALEKSERERGQREVPHYKDMQPPKEIFFSWKRSLFLLGSLLLAVLIFSAVKWLPLIDLQDKQLSEKNTILNYVSLSELERSGIPASRINAVSISTDRERRFVMIGEKMYSEGDSVAENIKLSTIEKDHIIFDKQGTFIRRDLE